MAGKATSCYLTICAKGTHTAVTRKVFFTAAAMNQYLKSDECKEKFPADQYDFVKEIY
jgi:hypothetical protein